MGDHDRYTLAQRWLLRRDPGLVHPNTLHDIYSGRTLYLSDGAFLAAAVWEHNAATPAEVTAFLTGRRAGPPPGRVAPLAEELAATGVLVPAAGAGAGAVAGAGRGAGAGAGGAPGVHVAEAPLDVEIHPARHCNLSCRHCAYDAPAAPGPVLPLSAWVAIIDELAALRTRHIIVSGGEPCLYPGFDGLVEHLAGKRMRVGVLTNGTLITPGRARSLARPHIAVTVSLDGPDAVTHDWLRGRGAFARVRAGLDLLVRHGVAVNIAMTVHRLNACAMEAVLRAGVAVGARTVGFLMIDSIGRAARDRQLGLTRRELASAVERARDLAARFGEATRVAYLDSSELHYQDFELPAPSAPIFCTAGTTRIAIRSDGTVHPCVYSFGDDSFAMGQAPADAIADIWASPRWRPFRGGIGLDDLRECRSCVDAASCTLKLCRLRAYCASGDLLAAPPGCRRHQVACS